ncbi:MAG: hypothetical protein K0S01_3457 [Herbinix sp.]|nr:hypothetical protein [Herbinix sp.]
MECTENFGRQVGISAGMYFRLQYIFVHCSSLGRHGKESCLLDTNNLHSAVL